MLLLLLFAVFPVLSQEKLETAKAFFNESKYRKAKAELQKIDLEDLEENEKGGYYLLSGQIYDRLGDAELACQDFFRAREFFRANGQEEILLANIELADHLGSLETASENPKVYLQEFFDSASKTGNPHHMARAYKSLANLLVEEDIPQAIIHYKKALSYNEKAKDSTLAVRIYVNLALLYTVEKTNTDSSFYFLEQAKRLNPKQGHYTNQAFILINEAAVYRKSGKLEEARKRLETAAGLPMEEFSEKTKSLALLFLSETLYEKGQFQDAYDELSRHMEVKDSLNELKQNLAISDIEARYGVKEKELVNLRLRSVNYAIAGVLLGVLVVSVLAYKNISRKHKIAKQEKFIETQQLQNKINEQELQQIDLMLETQEKERQRIADELHDELGSMLTTLKFNLENLAEKHPAEDVELVKHMDDLIGLTYQKVRNLSHLKNLGVAANEGLVQSITTMAEKMTIPGKLKVEVIPFLLGRRIDNATEVTLFRIVLELCTNAIKHSGASEINVYITQHEDDTLNLVIEDNGGGFEVSKIMKKDGIGLMKMEKKIEQMGGTLTIDSVKGSGTSIIIDVPA